MTPQVAVVVPEQPLPVQIKAVGWFVQLALTVVRAPAAGDVGLFVGAHTGAPLPPPLAQVIVCDPAGPEMLKLVQLGLVYESVAPNAACELHHIITPKAAPSIITPTRIQEAKLAVFTKSSPNDCMRASHASSFPLVPLSVCIG